MTILGNIVLFCCSLFSSFDHDQPSSGSVLYTPGTTSGVQVPGVEPRRYGSNGGTSHPGLSQSQTIKFGSVAFDTLSEPLPPTQVGMRSGASGTPKKIAILDKVEWLI